MHLRTQDEMFQSSSLDHRIVLRLRAHHRSHVQQHHHQNVHRLQPHQAIAGKRATLIVMNLMRMHEHQYQYQHAVRDQLHQVRIVVHGQDHLELLSSMHDLHQELP